MKKAILILVVGALLGALAFGGVYYFGTASSRQMMRVDQPELAWLKKEFDLGDAEYARIVELHNAYLPQCAERCRLIAEQNDKLEHLISTSTVVTPEIKAVLEERGRLRTACEAEMLRHFLAVAKTMPAEQGKRYLSWVEQQCCLNQGMEQHHSMSEHHHH